MDEYNKDYHKLLQIIPEIKIWEQITKHMDTATLNIFLNTFPVLRLFNNLHFANKPEPVGTFKLNETPIFIRNRCAEEYYSNRICRQISI